jgi:hypothetical protein
MCFAFDTGKKLSEMAIMVSFISMHKCNGHQGSREHHPSIMGLPSLVISWGPLFRRKWMAMHHDLLEQILNPLKPRERSREVDTTWPRVRSC